jgi:phenylalanyl-tRNA synthetase beta chain
MVTVDISFSQLRQFLGEPYASTFTILDLENLLFKLGFEIDDVAEDGDLLKIEITPDRLDAASLYGFARVIKAYLGLSSPQTYETYDSEYEIIIDSSVAAVRPYTVCAVVKGLSLTQTQLAQLIAVQEKLHATFGKQRKKGAIGIYPLHKLSWPISFVAKPKKDIFFTPLGMTEELSADDILAQHDTGKTYAHLLSGLDSYPLFIDAKGDVLSMPPIINSEYCGKVCVGDTEVFIECSGFDLFALDTLLKNLVCLFSDMGGTIYTVKHTYKYAKERVDGLSLFAKSVEDSVQDSNMTSASGADVALTLPVLRGEKRTLYTQRVRDLLGVELSATQISALLERMLYHATPLFDDTVELVVPPYRYDIWHDVDVIDDILRAYGLDKIAPILPQLCTTGDLLDINRFEAQLTDALVGLGFIEVKTLGVTDKDDQFTKMGVSVSDLVAHTDYVALGSTAERSINMLRVTLLPELLKLLMHNRSVTLPHAIFEVGHVIVADDTCDVASKNVPHLCIVKSSEQLTFTDVRQIVDYIGTYFGVTFAYEPLVVTQTCAHFIAGRSATISLNGIEVGVCGEIAPVVLRNFGLETPSIACEIDVALLSEVILKSD